MLRTFARKGYVPFLEELLSMGADAASEEPLEVRIRWRCEAEEVGDSGAGQERREAG
jgi:hypothetical protein